ncbi:hypothetical protein FDP08_02280 [Marinobacter panjinensis]|uniref:TnsA endonuclease N-terminal domain-containing protein n=1 Tax=Marinobacter panjinensis TaxID=2576384 RepID=A0A4U6R060_9GAMM|nr:hypothetical protein [Marinobacter panjinensis]MCR8916041.1 hypothetical protein [Marinobacter panjinensis]TKV66997.1 hypothetical protein FDP08_02280 [Marinobacter panjinensis]
MNLPDNRDTTVRIRAPSLTPCQVKTNPRFQIATDYRVAQLLKHAEPCEFHSLAEYYHALLLEGDPSVTRYVPQPFFFKINGRHYTPDCYIVRDGQEEVVELRPKAKFDEHRRQALVAFLRPHRMRFVVISNEAVVSRRIEAENWQMIVQALAIHRDLDTGCRELELLDQVVRNGGTCLGERVLPGDRQSSRVDEIALLRLMHRGKLTADLTTHRFGFGTELRPCL